MSDLPWSLIYQTTRKEDDDSSRLRFVSPSATSGAGHPNWWPTPLIGKDVTITTDSARAKMDRAFAEHPELREVHAEKFGATVRAAGKGTAHSTDNGEALETFRQAVARLIADRDRIVAELGSAPSDNAIREAYKKLSFKARMLASKRQAVYRADRTMRFQTLVQMDLVPDVYEGLPEHPSARAAREADGGWSESDDD